MNKRKIPHSPHSPHSKHRRRGYPRYPQHPAGIVDITTGELLSVAEVKEAILAGDMPLINLVALSEPINLSMPELYSIFALAMEYPTAKRLVRPAEPMAPPFTAHFVSQSGKTLSASDLSTQVQAAHPADWIKKVRLVVTSNNGNEISLPADRIVGFSELLDEICKKDITMLNIWHHRLDEE